MPFRVLIFCFLAGLSVMAADSFTVATYNVENYFLTPYATRKGKTLASREKVAETIALIRPDVLALQEMGRKVALDDLRNRLSQKNLNYTKEYLKSRHIFCLPYSNPPKAWC